MPKKNSRRRHRAYEAPIPTICGGIPVTAIDVPVRRLVRILNRLPGCHTVSSCGGHPNPQDAQASDGQWYIDFDLDETRAGWHTLNLLAWLCTDTGEITLTPWSADPDDGTRFELRGPHLSGLTLEVNLIEWFTRRQGRG